MRFTQHRKPWFQYQPFLFLVHWWLVVIWGLLYNKIDSWFGRVFQGHPKKHDINPIDYDETMSDVDAHLWQRVMKVELEFMYSK